MYRPAKFDPPWTDFFTRPCPWFEKQLTSFHPFPRLPKELQLMIWEEAQPRRQVVSICCPMVDMKAVAQPDDPPPVMRLQYRRSGMLHACLDAAKAAMKTFTPALELYLPSPIRFNFDRDILELDMHMVEYIATLHEEEWIPLEDIELVKTVAVSHYRRFRSEDLVLVCQYFTGLEYLMINGPEADYPNSSGGAVQLLARKDFKWKNLERFITRPIRNVRPKLENWQPPILLTGTDRQWARIAINRRFIRKFFDRPVLDPDAMNWSPTFDIPSLGYASRFRSASGQTLAISHQHKEYVKPSLEDDLGLAMANMMAWVFENAALQFRIFDPNNPRSVGSLVWSGREEVREFSGESLFEQLCWARSKPSFW